MGLPRQIEITHAAFHAPAHHTTPTHTAQGNRAFMASDAEDDAKPAAVAAAAAPPAQTSPPAQEPEQASYRWPLFILFLSYVFLLYMRDTSSAGQKEAAVAHPTSHQRGAPPGLVIAPEKEAAAAMMPSLVVPHASHPPRLLVQYCTS